MSKYDDLKKRHESCKAQMSSRDWQKFAIQSKPYLCPICGKR